MKINEILKQFEIFITNEERELLKKMSHARLLSSYSERDRFIIEGMIRKSLVIKIGDKDPRVVANEL